MPMAIFQNVLLVFTFRHLPSRSLGNAVRNLRVVDLSGESLRTDTDGKDGDVAVRVAAALPANQGTFGESAAGSVFMRSVWWSESFTPPQNPQFSFRSRCMRPQVSLLPNFLCRRSR